MAQEGLWNITQKEDVGGQGCLVQRGRRLDQRVQGHVRRNFYLGSWVREDVEGKAAQMENMSEDAKEEESKSGQREVEGTCSEVTLNGFVLITLFVTILVVIVLKFFHFGSGDFGHVGEATELSSVRAFDLTVSPEFEGDLPFPLLSNSQFKCGVLPLLAPFCCVDSPRGQE